MSRSMRIRAMFVTAAFAAALPAHAFESELICKRDADVAEYKSEQGALLFDDKGNETEFSIDYGSYKKNFVILLTRDTGAKTKTESRVSEIVQVIRAPKPKGLKACGIGPDGVVNFSPGPGLPDS